MSPEMLIKSANEFFFELEMRSRSNFIREYSYKYYHAIVIAHVEITDEKTKFLQVSRIIFYPIEVFGVYNQ